MSEPLLEIEDLTIQYKTRGGMLTAVSDASFTIDEAEYFGVVGESGCGKSTIAKAIMGGLDDNGQIASGTIKYRGEEIQDFTERELNKNIRWDEIAWIPQGSMSSLDPLERVSEKAAEITRTHTDLTKEETVDRLRELFDIVGLEPDRVTDYPHEFSGGMQQRALIAIALLLEPSLLIADEPTTALDVIMQDQVFTYLERIKDQLGSSLMMITHDISLVFEVCDKIAVMHAGQIAEVGGIRDIYHTPHHPYSILLQEAFPDIRHPNRELGVIEGNPPQHLGAVDYCSFVNRCPWAIEECSKGAPPNETIDEGHYAACIRANEVRGLYEGDRKLNVSGDDSL